MIFLDVRVLLPFAISLYLYFFDIQYFILRRTGRCDASGCIRENCEVSERAHLKSTEMADDCPGAIEPNYRTENGAFCVSTACPFDAYLALFWELAACRALHYQVSTISILSIF